MITWRLFKRLLLAGTIIALPVTAYAQATISGAVTDSGPFESRSSCRALPPSVRRAISSS